MVKTIRGKVSFHDLKRLVLEHAVLEAAGVRVDGRNEDGYCHVESDNFAFKMVGLERMFIELREMGESESWYSDGKALKPRTVAFAYISPHIYRDGCQLRIEVHSGEPEPVKQFIEDLVGKPCVVVPMTKKEKLANQPPLEEQLQKTLENLDNMASKRA